MQAANDEEDADNENHAPSSKTANVRSEPNALNVYSSTTWKPSKLNGTISAILIFTLVFAYTSFRSFARHDPANASACRMAYMSPGYIRMDSLDAQHSRLAGKYSLWLYREQGWDLSIKVSMVISRVDVELQADAPVFFDTYIVHSHMVRQCSSRLEMRGRIDKSEVWLQQLRECITSLLESQGAIFKRQELKNSTSLPVSQDSTRLRVLLLISSSADFNEDFSAFHAATLMEQAEFLADSVKFILNLYRSLPNPPASVIVLAHSMGGIASRLMLLESQLPEDSIKTMITLSTPHAIPPATFDGRLDAIYERINGHWRSAYSQEAHPLHDLLLISIAGGTADTTVSSDYSDISHFTPGSNGFAVLTSSIPSVRTPVDHLAMMWCDQLRQTIIALLLHTVDAATTSRARPLAARLEAARIFLLESLDQVAPSSASAEAPFDLALSDILIMQGTSFAIVPDVQSRMVYYALPISEEVDAGSVQILTELEQTNIEVLLCASSPQDKQSLSCRSMKGLAWHKLPLDVKDAPGSSGTASYLEVSAGDGTKQVIIGVKASKHGTLLVCQGSTGTQTLTPSLLSKCPHAFCLSLC